MKYIELFKNGFDSTITEKIKPENWPYVGYSPSEGLLLTDILKETPINYFYIESLDDNNVITLDSTTWAGYGDNKSKLEYSNDTTSWTSMNDVDSITINNGERLYMRCIEGNICKDMYSIPEEESETVMFAPLFKTSTNCNVGGNINTVMFDHTYKTEDCVLPAGAFAGLFMGVDMMTGEFANYIIDASKLVLPSMEVTYGCYIYMFYSCSSLTATPELPATTLADDCYGAMFAGCTSLISAPELPATTLADDCYGAMFAGCTSLISAPELPAMTLSNGCYSSMFEDCCSLTTAPVLPVMALSNDCYNSMFRNCISLTTAPVLPATELAESCYLSMFEGCISLITAPELPATTLVESCYSDMFCNCTSLTTAPILPATTLVDNCYSRMFNSCTFLTAAPVLPATTLANYCYYEMFRSCTSLTTAPELPATTLAEYCYVHMFSGCTSLTTAPELPAATLVLGCYNVMFQGCTSLNYIKCLATDISANYCTWGWVDNVYQIGTFVKHHDMNDWKINLVDGIPIGWTVVDAEL